MIRYIIVSIASGLLFGILDGFLNANPIARKLYEVYKPISKTAVNVPVGMIIDFLYGFAMAGIFLILYKSLPGEAGLAKGFSFALLAWFFRVVMSTASQWMMLNIPASALLYSLAAGLCEMLILGLFYGWVLKV